MAQFNKIPSILCPTHRMHKEYVDILITSELSAVFSHFDLFIEPRKCSHPVEWTSYARIIIIIIIKLYFLYNFHMYA